MRFLPFPLPSFLPVVIRVATITRRTQTLLVSTSRTTDNVPKKSAFEKFFCIRYTHTKRCSAKIFRSLRCQTQKEEEKRVERRPNAMIRYCAATAQKGKKEEEEKLCFIGKSFPPLISREEGREKKSFPPLYCFAESNCCHPGGGEGERE